MDTPPTAPTETTSPAFPPNAPRPNIPTTRFAFDSGYATGIKFGSASSHMSRMKPLKPNILDRQAEISKRELAKERAGAKWKVVREL